MSRTILAMSGALAASSLLLVDWAVKGTALLLLAGIATVMLRRDSAATRHLAWLLAIVAMLFVPVLSALLPQWRVLPEWAGVGSARVSDDSRSLATSATPIFSAANDGSDSPQIAAQAQVKAVQMGAGQVAARQIGARELQRPVGEQPVSPPAPAAAAEVTAEPADGSWTEANSLSSVLIGALPLVWAIGFAVLILRLVAARWMLWNAERRGTVVWSSVSRSTDQLATTTHDSAAAASAVCMQLGIRRPVTVLIHPEKTIPVVWGVFRCYLLLPEAARDWSGEQLRSVLLHELAHVKRRDTLAQLLTQIACALHWFNPLVWLAAWRLGVERERACDDLVLASGVRPSAYAGHLLDVVTGNSPARFSQACGLAMARQSSLEGRLSAVLAENLNRRGVSVVLAAVALAIALGIAVPIAMLRAADNAADAVPEDEESKAKATSGVEPQDEGPRLVVESGIHVGATLSAERQAALKFGPIAENGLCAAWSRYPARDTYLVGDYVHSSVVIRNASEAVVEFKCPYSLDAIVNWNARADGGRKIEAKKSRYTGTIPLRTWRLKPGEVTEIYGRATKIGEVERRAGVDAASMATVLLAKRGENVNVEWKLSEPVEMTTGEVSFKVAGIEDVAVWSTSQDGRWPMPGGVTLEVKQQIIHATDIMSTAILTWPMNKAGFTARHQIFLGGDAFAARAPWLLAWERGATVLWAMSGQMQSSQDFHNVLPTPSTLRQIDFSNPEKITQTSWGYVPDLVPDAIRAEFAKGFLPLATTPRTPDHAKPSVIISRAEDVRPVKELMNGVWKSAKGYMDVRITFPDRPSDGVHWKMTFERPQGNATVSERLAPMDSPQDGSVLLTKPRRQPRTPGTATLGRLKRGIDDTLLLDVMPHVDFPEYERADGIVLERESAAVRQQEPQKPKDGAKLRPGTEEKLQWSEPASGLRMALCWPPVLDEPAVGDVPDLHLAVQNVSKAPVRLCTTAEATLQRRLTHKSKGTIQFVIVDDKPAGIDCTLQPREVVFLRLFTPDDRPGAAPVSSEIASGVRRMPQYFLVAEMEISKVPAGAWTGKLTTPDTRAGVGADAPKNRKAQELFKAWLQHTRVNGKIPGGLIARVGERVQEFVKANAADKSGAPYAKRMAPLVPRLDGTRDWQPPEAAALLDDISAVSDSPLSVALEEIAGGTVNYGLALPKELENAPWGEPLSNGLRTATIIGPGLASRLYYVDHVGNVVTQGAASSDKDPARSASGSETSSAAIRLGTPLGCRILIHNAGKAPVVFRTRAWHHIEPTAKDAKGAEIGMESVTRFTRAPLMTWRLEPGRYIELASPGFGLGKWGYHDFGSADIASWIDAKAGDEVTLTPGPLPLFDWNNSPAADGEPRWWLDFIIARLSQATPLPADATERGALLRKVMADVFRQDIRPTDEETAAFLKDTSPQAITNLAERIFHRPGLHAWAGPLQSAPTKFRVTAADPPGAKGGAAPAATPPPAAPAETPKTDGAASAQRVRPKHEDAQALYESWSTAARADGKIPGALIGLLGESVKTFIKNNPTWKTTPQLEKMLARFDASRDWSGQEAVALLDELAAIQDTPISMALERDQRGIIQSGEPLPPQLARAPWGEATEGGLRVAYLLEPRLVYQRLGTPLKGRILIHNAGTEPVVFRAWSWHQAGHKATDAQGADINIFSLEWTTLGRLEPFRLAPGEFIEINTAGIGVGADRKVDDWQNIRVGSWIEAKEGDEVTLTTEPIPLRDGNEEAPLVGEPRWWLDHIKARLSRHQPFPADAEVRKLIVNRVAMELFGTPASDEITNAFVSDFRPTALDSLAQLLARRPGLAAFSGSLVSSPTKFRVRPADPDAAKRPRVASNPGWYTLGEHARLDVSRRRDGELIVNEATILFFSRDPKADAPGKPVPIELPDGYHTWAAAWERGATVMWVTQKGLLRKVDFSKPEKVEMARYEADNVASAPIPADIREALRAALAVPDAPKQVQEPLPPASAAHAAEAPKSERPK